MILVAEDIAKGQVMWKVGDRATFAFVVKKGSFEFITPLLNSEETRTTTANDDDELESGTFVGESDAILHETPMKTHVVATRKSQIFKIAANDLLAFLSKNPGLLLIFQGTTFVE